MQYADAIQLAGYLVAACQQKIPFIRATAREARNGRLNTQIEYDPKERYPRFKTKGPETRYWSRRIRANFAGIIARENYEELAGLNGPRFRVPANVKQMAATASALCGRAVSIARLYHRACDFVDPDQLLIATLVIAAELVSRGTVEREFVREVLKHRKEEMLNA